MRKLFAVLLAALVLAGSAYGVLVTETIKIHQDKFEQGATDLHFIAYQSEPGIYIKEWKVTTDPPFPFITGWVDDYPIGDGDPHCVHVDCWGLVIPYCTWVTIEVQFELNEYNKIIIDSILWTYENPDDPTDPVDTLKSDVPGHGFEVDYIDDAGNSTYIFRNAGDKAVIVKDFRYARNQEELISSAKLFDWSGWTDKEPDFVVEPESKYIIGLADMKPGLYFFTNYKLYLPGDSKDGDQLVAEGVQIHEDQTKPGQSMGIKESGLLPDVKFIDVNSYPDYSEIRYQLPKATNAIVTVYSVTGEKVATLVNERKAAGAYTIRWDGTADDGTKVSAGLYVCRLSADGIQAAEKTIRLK